MVWWALDKIEGSEPRKEKHLPHFPSPFLSRLYCSFSRLPLSKHQQSCQLHRLYYSLFTKVGLPLPSTRSYVLSISLFPSSSPRGTSTLPRSLKRVKIREIKIVSKVQEINPNIFEDISNIIINFETKNDRVEIRKFRDDNILYLLFHQNLLIVLDLNRKYVIRGQWFAREVPLEILQ